MATAPVPCRARGLDNSLGEAWQRVGPSSPFRPSNARGFRGTGAPRATWKGPTSLWGGRHAFAHLLKAVSHSSAAHGRRFCARYALQPRRQPPWASASITGLVLLSRGPCLGWNCIGGVLRPWKRTAHPRRVSHAIRQNARTQRCTRRGMRRPLLCGPTSTPPPHGRPRPPLCIGRQWVVGALPSSFPLRH